MDRRECLAGLAALPFIGWLRTVEGTEPPLSKTGLLSFEIDYPGAGVRMESYRRLAGTVNAQPWKGYPAGTCLLLNFRYAVWDKPKAPFEVYYHPDGHGLPLPNGDGTVAYESKSFLPLASARRVEPERHK